MFWPLLAVADAISVIGILLWTIPPMQPKALSEVLRWATRGSAALWFILDAGYFIVRHFPRRSQTTDIVLYVLMVAASITTFGGFFYLAELAGRLRGQLVRRVCLALVIGSLMMPIGIVRSGVFRPRVGMVELPQAVYPMTGQIEEVLLIRSGIGEVRIGRKPLVRFLGEFSLLIAWMTLSSATILWYGMILLAISSKNSSTRK